MAGVGFDARAVAGVNLGLKRLGGKFAYIWSGLVAWCGWRPEPIEIVPENGPARQGYGASISNGRYYGGRLSTLLQHILRVHVRRDGDARA
jgi:diacylglycerol kinase family enzyme